MTDQKENSMTILDEEEAERLDQLREHIRQGVVPGHASALFLMTVIDRQAAAMGGAGLLLEECSDEPNNSAAIAEVLDVLRGGS